MLDDFKNTDTQQPPAKLKVGDFAAKVKAKYPEYKDVPDDVLTQKIIDKYPEYKDQVDLTPTVKKKEVTPSISSDGQLSAPKAEEPQDALSEARKYDELSHKGVTVGEGLEGGFGDFHPDLDAQKQAEDLYNTQKAAGVDVKKLSSDFKDLSDADLTPEKRSELLNLYSTNKEKYERALGAVKWSSQLQHKIDTNADIPPQDKPSIISSINEAANMEEGDYNSNRQKLRNLSRIIKQYGGEDADKMLRNLGTDYSINYGYAATHPEAVAADDLFSSKLNSTQLAAWHFLNDTNPKEANKYKAALLNDSDIKGNTEAQLGKQEAGKALDEIGIQLGRNYAQEKLKPIADEYSQLADKNKKEGLSPEEQQRYVALEQEGKPYADALNYVNEADKLKAARYPSASNLDAMNFANELLGQKNTGLNWLTLETGKATENAARGIWDIVATPFRSDKEEQLHQSEILGRQSLNEHSTYLNQDKQMLQSFKPEVSPELQKDIDKIKNDKDLSADEKRSKVEDLLVQRPDEYKRIPIEGGKTNINLTSLLYGTGKMAADLAPFIVAEMATGGGATASFARKFTSSFTAAAATSFEESYADAVKNGEANPYAHAMRVTAINSAALAGAQTPQAIRKMLGGSTAIGKLVSDMTDDGIMAALKETPTALKLLGNGVKDALKNTAKGIGEGAKITAFTTAGQVANDAIDDQLKKPQDYARQAALEMMKFGVFSLAGSTARKLTQPSDLKLGTIFSAAEKPEPFLEALKQKEDNGIISAEEAQQIRSNIEKVADIYQKSPILKNKNLTDDAKREYLYNEIVKRDAKDDEKNLPPRQAEKAAHTALVAEYKNAIIIDPPKDLEKRKQQLEKELIPEQDADGKNIPINEKELAHTKAELEAVNDAIERKAKGVEVVPPQKQNKPIEIGEEANLAKANENGVTVEKPQTIPESIPLTKDTDTLIKEAKNSGKLGVFAKMDNEGLLKMVAEQAQNIGEKGDEGRPEHADQAMQATINQFGKPLVDAAIEKHPKESLLKNKTNENASISEPSARTLGTHENGNKSAGRNSESSGMGRSEQGNEPTTESPTQEGGNEGGGEENAQKKGITHAAVAELRKIVELPEYEGKPKQTHEELIAEAQDTIKNNPNAANEVLDKMENDKEVTNKDNAIAAVYKATLDAELEKAPTKELLDRARRLSKAVDISGTKLGKALESRKLVGGEANLANFLLDKEVAQGTALTDNQIKSEAAKYEELKTAKEALEKQLLQEREQHAKDIAELGLNKAKAKAKKESKKSNEDYKAERKASVDAAREALKKIREEGSLKSTIPGVAELKAIAPHVKEYLNSLASQGIDKLDNVITQIHAEFKDVLDGLSKKDVLGILAGEYDEPNIQQTKNQKANAIRLLKREAELVKELERARKGEENATSEPKKVEANRRIDELKEKIKEVRRLNKDNKEEEPVHDISAGTNEDAAKYEKRLQNRIEKLNKDLKEKKYLNEAEKPPVFKKTRKAQILEDRVIDLENKIRHEHSKDEYNKRGKARKVFDKIMEVLGIRRLVQSAVDISVPFRQGATLLSPRKIDVWVKGFQANLQSIFSPKKFERIMSDIRKDPMYHDMIKDNVVFNDLGSADPNLHNEDFRKSFIYKIPIISEPLKASNRSADAFLNVARIELYKKLRDNLEKRGLTRESDPKAFKYIGNWVMSMTGRGKMHSALEKPAMNAVLGNTFYGARLMASRFNLLNPLTYFDPRIPKEAKHEAMKDMVAFTATMMTVATALAYTTGAKISLNPDDSDFLQLRYGDKVYDISGGLANYVRTGLRIAKAGYTKATGTKYEGNKATEKAGESTLNFFRNKLSPNTGYAVDAFFGGRYGSGFDPSDIYRIYPMYTDDYMKAWKEEGGLTATATVLVPNILGIGYGSYASKGQIDANLEDLLKRNLRSDEMNNEKIKNYNDGNRPITKDEFNDFADKRDEEIKTGLTKLYNEGAPVINEQGEAEMVPYKDLTQDQVVKETNRIKAIATKKVKEEMFGKNENTGEEKYQQKQIEHLRKENSE